MYNNQNHSFHFINIINMNLYYVNMVEVNILCMLSNLMVFCLFSVKTVLLANNLYFYMCRDTLVI